MFFFLNTVGKNKKHRLKKKYSNTMFKPGLESLIPEQLLIF